MKPLPRKKNQGCLRQWRSIQMQLIHQQHPKMNRTLRPNLWYSSSSFACFFFLLQLVLLLKPTRNCFSWSFRKLPGGEFLDISSFFVVPRLVAVCAFVIGRTRKTRPVNSVQLPLGVFSHVLIFFLYTRNKIRKNKMLFDITQAGSLLRWEDVWMRRSLSSFYLLDLSDQLILQRLRSEGIKWSLMDNARSIYTTFTLSRWADCLEKKVISSLLRFIDWNVKENSHYPCPWHQFQSDSSLTPLHSCRRKAQETSDENLPASSSFILPWLSSWFIWRDYSCFE